MRTLSMQVLKNASHQHRVSQKLLLNQLFRVRIGSPADVWLTSAEHQPPVDRTRCSLSEAMYA
ncbi:hypothetical protein ALQ95_101651 [Pseudomonas syringae pv. ribicola]|uniref:Uncharacterized protein n=1 Tax=Pseudomonas syringae pv. ribicola TaxID=55398 RepID=A0A3M2W654_PSESI|nr:hypothetical protein ALQ95_101651 [Pseudomonas syringae pv. ribicola]